MCWLFKCQPLLIQYVSSLVSLGREPKQYQRLFVLGAIEIAVKQNQFLPQAAHSLMKKYKQQASRKKGKDEKARRTAGYTNIWV